MAATSDPVTVLEFEALARARVEPSVDNYFGGASGDERKLAENRLAFDHVVLRPRVLVDVGHISSTMR